MSLTDPTFIYVYGFEERYSINSQGKVFSHLRNKFLRDRPNRGGYPVISLRKGGKAHWFTVHALVAKHFIGPRPKGLTINHKDGNKLNRAVNNLEYITLSENIKHAFRTGIKVISEERKQALRTYGIGRKPPNRRFQARQILAIRVAYAKGNISMLQLSHKWKTSTSEIHRIVHHKIYK